MLDFIQYKYLQYFLPQLIKRKHNLFVKNLIFFVTGGMAVSILILATRYKITLEAIENPQKNYLYGMTKIKFRDNARVFFSIYNQFEGTE